jgi:hypothetical protein
MRWHSQRQLLSINLMAVKKFVLWMAGTSLVFNCHTLPSNCHTFVLQKGKVWQ